MQYTFPVPTEEQHKKEVVDLPKKTPDAISAEVERYLQNYSPQTVKAYRSDLYDFWTFTNRPLQNTKEDDILRYIEHLEKRQYSNSTINRRISSLSKLCSIYVAMKLMTYNPVQNLGSIGKLYKQIDNSISLKITKHDIEAVVANANKKTSTIVRFLANTGVRVSEMTHIKKEDVEAFDHSWLRLKLTAAKGGKIRFVFVSYDLYQEIKDAFDTDSIYLFSTSTGNMMSRVNVYKQVKRAFKKYAFRDGVHPHLLRHYFATTKIRDEKKDYKAVSTYLGHANVATTLSIYTTSQLSPEETVII